ncbi:von Hippel-Lindau disease tumor suppressor-like [Lineus longissimus]|uniref:von Hippel-Lindau disease tumor suppressor-like n=1 Tax=Lineus longissimus TaxID=88925 RepID=UPI00315D270D
MEDGENARFHESDNRQHETPRKSIDTQMHSYVRFVNLTLRRVDVIWLNYQGIRVHYKTLDPEQYFNINTYVGHPWIFRDSLTGDKLVVRLKEVFEPVVWTGDDGWPPQRKVVNITIPVYSLKERCLQILRRVVPRKHINHLEIPHTLKVELRNEDGEEQEEMLKYEPSG